jgi:hypothetical protein
MQYAAYHFQVDDIRAIVPEGQEMLMIGRWLSRHVPSVARLEVMHGGATTPMVDGPAYVIAFPNPPKALRDSLDSQLHKMKGYKGMRIIELGHEAGYDLAKGRIPKP